MKLQDLDPSLVRLFIIAILLLSGLGAEEVGMI